MKLLLITQKVNKNDDTLGFFHAWLLQFAEKCERLTIIALEVGPHDLPPHVKVLSLGKEKGSSRLQYVTRFYRYIVSEWKNYTHVFVHMNQIYVILGGLMWRLGGKKIGLWYVHRQVSTSLRIATKFAHIIFTAAKESFNIKTSKLEIVGHGIDVAQFRVVQSNTKTGRKIRIISIGRITRIKNLSTLILAAEMLKRDGADFVVDLIGPAVTAKDQTYKAELVKLIAEKDLSEIVVFSGGVPIQEVSKCYIGTDLSVNLTPTGGIDKVVLESLAAGVPALTSNKAFISIFGAFHEKLVFNFGNAEDLARKIKKLLDEKDTVQYAEMKTELRNKIQNEFDISVIVTKIISLMLK